MQKPIAITMGGFAPNDLQIYCGVRIAFCVLIEMIEAFFFSIADYENFVLVLHSFICKKINGTRQRQMKYVYIVFNLHNLLLLPFGCSFHGIFKSFKLTLHFIRTLNQDASFNKLIVTINKSTRF